MIPVLHFVYVKLWDVHVLGLPGGLVIWQLSPLDQVVDIVLPVHTEKQSQDKQGLFLSQNKEEL